MELKRQALCSDLHTALDPWFSGYSFADHLDAAISTAVENSTAYTDQWTVSTRNETGRLHSSSIAPRRIHMRVYRLSLNSVVDWSRPPSKPHSRVTPPHGYGYSLRLIVPAHTAHGVAAPASWRLSQPAVSFHPPHPASTTFFAPPTVVSTPVLDLPRSRLFCTSAEFIVNHLHATALDELTSCVRDACSSLLPANPPATAISANLAQRLDALASSGDSDDEAASDNSPSPSIADASTAAPLPSSLLDLDLTNLDKTMERVLVDDRTVISLIIVNMPN